MRSNRLLGVHRAYCDRVGGEMARRRSWPLGVALGVLATAAAASCSRHSETTSQDGPDASAPGAASADARLAELRARFEIARASVRLEPLSATHVRAVVAAQARSAVRRAASVELPMTADGAVRVTDGASRVGVAFTMRGASASPLSQASDGVALYAGGARGG